MPTDALELTFIATDGKIPRSVWERLGEAAAKMAGKTLVVSLREQKQTSSAEQRRYYFGVIVKAFQAYFRKQGKWYDKAVMHNSMMISVGGFAKPFVNPFTGLPEEDRMSYNDLTKIQTEGYHTLCRQWLAERGVDCPEPNEVPIEAYES